ncbi:MAG: metal-dependent hydrolase [Desulfobacterium sp.]|nr:metal-dependent hydrolase [Desulfobacterium sp.]
MAGFKTHLTGGVVSGAGISALGLVSYNFNMLQASSIFILGVVGGILPDLDSDSGKPLALIFGILSVLIPTLLLPRITDSKIISPEFLVCYFVGGYLIINYLICGLIKKLTIHRGIMHSIPFAILSGEAGYLLFISSSQNMAEMVGLSVFAGCMGHLILDELNSISFKFGLIPVWKRSSGTAFKITSGNLFATLFVYCLVFGAAAMIFLAS